LIGVSWLATSGIVQPFYPTFCSCQTPGFARTNNATILTSFNL
jgi:hypothetical protein